MGQRVPSRTILLHPDPGAKADRLDARVEHERFPEAERSVCAEIVHVWLRGRTARGAGERRPAAADPGPARLPALARASAVRRTAQYDQLVGVSDRLIVDSSEWHGLAGGVSPG